MAEELIHRIEDDLGEGWLENWTATGISEIENYLEKQAAFKTFLESHDS